MKNILFIALLFTLLFNCSEDNTTLNNDKSDTKTIAEYHIVNNDGDINFKYLFNNQGRVNSVININDDSVFEYLFDSSNNLTDIFKTNNDGLTENILTIIYDSENRISQIGEDTFLYNPDLSDFIPIDNYDFPFEYENFYIKDSSIYSNTQEGEQEIIFPVYFTDSNGNISHYTNWYEIIIIDGIVVQDGYFDKYYWRYENDQLLNYGHNEAPINYNYNTITNPLYSEQTNLSYATPIISSYITNSYDRNIIFNKNLYSAQTISNQRYDSEDPESVEFNYELNLFGLPTKLILQSYYLDTLENEAVASKYYYQGDVIPE